MNTNKNDLRTNYFEQTKLALMGKLQAYPGIKYMPIVPSKIFTRQHNDHPWDRVVGAWPTVTRLQFDDTLDRIIAKLYGAVQALNGAYAFDAETVEYSKQLCRAASKITEAVQKFTTDVDATLGLRAQFLDIAVILHSYSARSFLSRQWNMNYNRAVWLQLYAVAHALILTIVSMKGLPSLSSVTVGMVTNLVDASGDATLQDYVEWMYEEVALAYSYMAHSH